jgi:peptidyl-prolyl cis-trans isomerase A (cyclophilin A)
MLNRRTGIMAALVACISLALPFQPIAAATLPRVAIVTSVGTIVLQLDPVHAPITTKNFLHLVDTHAYDGADFYRTVTKVTEPESQIEVIQGGLQVANRIPSQTIPLEKTTKTGLHNTAGVISMARTQYPNSASSEFFICIGNNQFLDADHQPDGNGYAAFGHVIKGYDVVLKINRKYAVNEMIDPPVKILRVRRV